MPKPINDQVGLLLGTFSLQSVAALHGRVAARRAVGLL